MSDMYTKEEMKFKFTPEDFNNCDSACVFDQKSVAERANSILEQWEKEGCALHEADEKEIRRLNRKLDIAIAALEKSAACLSPSAIGALTLIENL